ncbi:MAG: hypothetical protein ABIT71_12855 [Vicinamibacteraceae bacterium]
MTTHDLQHRPQVHTTGPKRTRIPAGHLLVLLRRHRIPCSIDSLSDSGWTARLGEPGKGAYSQQGCFRTLDDAAEWLLAEAERRGSGPMAGSD